MKKFYIYLLCSFACASAFAVSPKYGGATRATADNLAIATRAKEKSEPKASPTTPPTSKPSASKIGSSKPASVKAGSVSIYLNKDGEIFWNGEKIDIKEMKLRFEELSDNPPEIRINANPNTQYSKVQEVVNAANERGLNKLSLDKPAPSEKKPPKKPSETSQKDKYSSAKPFDISYVRARHLSAAETRTTGEIFSGEEMTHGQLTLRTDPKSRSGMYFFVMLDSYFEDLIPGTTVEISFDASDYPHPRTHTFTIAEPHSTFREMRFGVTGDDWVSSKGRVNAWRVVIRDPQGREIARKESWLWSMKNAKK